MLPFFQEHFGNPSAIYSYGLEANKALEESRRAVAKALGALSSEIFFVSGGTESDNWAIHSVAERYGDKGKHVVSTAIEHKAVLNTLGKLKERGFEVTLLPPDRDGLVSPERLARALRDDTILVSVMMANNVVGTIMDVKALAKEAHKRKAVFHVDAVQAAGYLPIDVRDLDVDLLSISGHKFHGPKGAGALFAKIPRLPTAYLTGGGQERGGRSGTENLPGIVGMAKALKEAVANLERVEELKSLRDRLIEGILTIQGSFLTGDEVRRLPGLASFVFTGLRSSVYLINSLNEKGICASSGSACSASSQEASHVLKSMGYTDDLAMASLRISLSHYNTAEEVRAIVEAMPDAVREARSRRL
jgi:cysteine desulfurase